MSGARRYAALRAGYNHNCALTAGGSAYCWGENLGGAVGNGTRQTQLTPVAVGGTLRFRALAAGANTCAIATTGVAYCWGDNSVGAIGQPDIEP